MIYETFRLDFQRYYDSGLLSARWIRDEVTPFKELANCNILDWGCGPGRVIRHMPDIVGKGCSFFGTDYNGEYIDWCGLNLRSIRFDKNQITPPTSYTTGSMDLIYGISIFTHLSDANHIAWFDELIRLLNDQGILFITTHGDITKENLTTEEQETYNQGKLVVRGEVKEGHRMFTAYQPIPYMNALYNDKVRILKHKPGTKQPWGYEQDMWILQKI